MKRCASLFMSALLAFSVLSTGAAMAQPPSPPAYAPAPVPEPHPHIRAALRELRECRKELETAAHDFGGHRKEALEAVDNAIKQLQEALQYDKN